MADNATTIDRAAELAGKYLTFFLADETYGVEVLKVREIIGMQTPTAVPRTPEFVRGVINLRGKVIPVVDLRRKLGMDEWAAGEQTAIIVTQVAGAEIGVVVDGVCEVLDVPAEQIEESPPFGANVDTHCILGLAKTDHRVTILLDITRILGPEEMTGAACAR